VLALACGLVASLGITQVMSKRGDDSATPAVDTQSIFVAMKDVPQGDPLTPQVLKLEQWPKDKLPAGGLNRLEDIEGRRARAKLYAGEPILENKLSPKGMNAPGADLLIPKGYRVVSIRVDAVSGGGNLVLPGCRVDLLVHMTKNPTMGLQETTTRTILQDIKVFAVNDVVTLDTNGPETKSIQARTVSLLVTPAQAEKVTLATELGTIKLVMRSPEEDTQVQTEGALPHELFGASDQGRPDQERAGEGLDFNAMKEKGQGFLDYLKTMREHVDAEKAAAAVPAKDTWSMRLLNGGDINDVTLEEADASQADGGSWKVNGLKAPGSGKESADAKNASQGKPAAENANAAAAPADQPSRKAALIDLIKKQFGQQ
jgi:pilus assembly protein CpaB